MAKAADCVMYSPDLVRPYQRSPWQWKTLVALLTQTRPLPPPSAGVAAGTVSGRVTGQAGVGRRVAGAGCVAAGAGIEAGLLVPPMGLVGWIAVDVPDQVLTPPCFKHARACVCARA